MRPSNMQRRRTIVVMVGLLMLVAVTACDRNQTTTGNQTKTRGSAATGPVISEALMLALAQAKNYHHKAKVLVADGKPAEAIVVVRQILALRFPANAPEADDVRHDARALLAKLLASQGQLDDAMSVIAEGLASATRDSFFVANLYTVQGELQQARAEVLAKDPARKTDADNARRAAIVAFDRSIQINTVLQQQLEGRPQ
jgi:hypothetical protein